MTLGIMVNSDRHLGNVVGLTRAAVAKGHEVLLFTMDTGCRLLADSRYTALAELPGVGMSVCEESATHHGVRLDELPQAIVQGSQYQNAVLTRTADRVIVL